MRVTFWGTRGSIPAPLNAAAFSKKVRGLLLDAGKADLNDERAVDAYLDSVPLPGAMTFGGDTSCVEIVSGNDRLTLDCGSGLRGLGCRMLAEEAARGRRIDILLSHTHWDHIMGFPFFGPALYGGYEVHMHGFHPDLRERFGTLMDRVHFPLTLEEMRSEIFFHQLAGNETFSLGPFSIGNIGLSHPGGSWAYRVSTNGKNVVFATDGEYRDRTAAGLAPFIEFYRGADLLIFDAMYSTLEQANAKADYGHSTAVIGVDIALRAGVKTLVLFHHDPESDDRQILDSFIRACSYRESMREEFPKNDLRIMAAFDGMSIEI